MTTTILIAEDEAEITDTLTYALTTEGMTPILNFSSGYSGRNGSF